MNTYEKVISVTFSAIVLIISLCLILTLGGILEPTLGSDMMTDIIGVGFLRKIAFVLAFALMLLSLREIIFGKKIETQGSEGIILENESGKLIISKESLENLVAGVGKEIDGAESISSRTFIDAEKNVTVNVNVVVNKDIVIKEVSAKLQKRVKEALKQTADLDVKYVNIKIKNISNKKTKKQTAGENVDNTKSE